MLTDFYFYFQLLSEANATISALREQLSRSEPSTSGAKELLSSRLQDSTTQLEVTASLTALQLKCLSSMQCDHNSDATWFLSF